MPSSRPRVTFRPTAETAAILAVLQKNSGRDTTTIVNESLLVAARAAGWSVPNVVKWHQQESQAAAEKQPEADNG